MFKKLLPLFLAIIMLLSSFSAAFAADEPEIESVSVTPRVNYTIYVCGTHTRTCWCCGGALTPTSQSYYAYLKIGARIAADYGTVRLSDSTYGNYAVTAKVYTDAQLTTAANGVLELYG